MMITPLAAREPYRLDAVASFNTLIDAISAAFIALISPSYGAPSTTNSGALDALMEPIPRMRIVELLPGCPLEEVVCKPVTRPCKALVTLGVSRLLILSELTVDT